MTFSASVVTVAVLAATVNGCGQEPRQTTPSAGGEASVTTEAVPYRVLLSTGVSGFTEPAERVVRDEAALDAMIRAAQRDALIEPIQVDFQREIAVVLALGERASAGYGIEVDEVIREGEGAVVRYTVTSPGPGCMTAQMITTPAVVIGIPPLSGEIRFERSERTEPC